MFAVVLCRCSGRVYRLLVRGGVEGVVVEGIYVPSLEFATRGAAAAAGMRNPQPATSQCRESCAWILLLLHSA